MHPTGVRVRIIARGRSQLLAPGGLSGRQRWVVTWFFVTLRGAARRPGARDAIGRENALQLLAELGDVQGRLDDLKRVRELAAER